MIYTENLENIIIERHKKNGADQLLFLGGFIGIQPIQNISEKINSSIKCDIIYGCYTKANKTIPIIKKYIDYTKNSNVNIFFSNNYNHAKIYMWLKNNKPIEVIQGSANFSSSGLCNDGQEILVDVPSNEHSCIYKFMLDAKLKSILCIDAIIKEVRPVENNTNLSIKLDKVLSNKIPEAKIYLGDKKGHVQERSALNWGFGKGNVGKDCSYIPIRLGLIKNLPSLFPFNGVNPNVGKGEGLRNKKQIAEAIFDDGFTMQLSFEGIAKPYYFKNLTSFPKNNILGKYIRKRLNLKEYDKIEYYHLKNYGRDDIGIKKVQDGLYYIDFSV